MNKFSENELEILYGLLKITLADRTTGISSGWFEKHNGHVTYRELATLAKKLEEMQ